MHTGFNAVYHLSQFSSFQLHSAKLSELCFSHRIGTLDRQKYCICVLMRRGKIHHSFLMASIVVDIKSSARSCNRIGNWCSVAVYPSDLLPYLSYKAECNTLDISILQKFVHCPLFLPQPHPIRISRMTHTTELWFYRGTTHDSKGSHHGLPLYRLLIVVPIIVIPGVHINLASLSIHDSLESIPSISAKHFTRGRTGACCWCDNWCRI